MGLEPRHQTSAAYAFHILHANVDSSDEALATLKQYIKHLEELLLVELGRDEFTRRLRSIQRKDEESLFIPEDNTNPRKRGSTSTDSGSSPKKSRSNSSASSLSLASGLGKSIFDKAKSESSDSSAPDVSPKTSRKSSVSERAVMDCQQATAQQMALRSVYPIPQFRRGSQSAMLPNTHPSSNFHSGSPAPSAARISQGPSAEQCPQNQLSSLSMRRDSVQPDGVSKSTHSSVHNTSFQHQTSPKSSSTVTGHRSRPAAPTLSRKPASSSVQSSSSSLSSSISTSSLVNRPSPSSSSRKLSSSSSTKHPSSVSNTLSSSAVSSKPFVTSKSSSVPSNSSSLSTSSLGASSEVLSGEPSSFKRKPWRAAKKG